MNIYYLYKYIIIYLKSDNNLWFKENIIYLYLILKKINLGKLFFFMSYI